VEKYQDGSQERPTGGDVCLGSGSDGPMGKIVDIHRDPRFGQVPEKVLYLVAAVLVEEQVNELVQPPLGELDEEPSGVAEVWIVWVQDVSGQEAAQIDDGLFIGRHVPLAQGADHLVRMQLLVHLALHDRVIVVLR
jgi:hypothetical protein